MCKTAVLRWLIGTLHHIQPVLVELSWGLCTRPAPGFTLPGKVASGHRRGALIQPVSISHPHCLLEISILALALQHRGLGFGLHVDAYWSLPWPSGLGMGISSKNTIRYSLGTIQLLIEDRTPSPPRRHTKLEMERRTLLTTLSLF